MENPETLGTLGTQDTGRRHWEHWSHKTQDGDKQYKTNSSQHRQLKRYGKHRLLTKLRMNPGAKCWYTKTCIVTILR